MHNYSKLTWSDPRGLNQRAESVFEKLVPRALLKPKPPGGMSRVRLFSKENAFRAFFSQVPDADGGCMEVIRKLQAYASIKGITVPSQEQISCGELLN